MKLSSAHEFSLEIDKVGSLGQGVGSDPEGNVYFVAGAVPGDRVKVLWRDYPGVGKYRDAQLLQIEVPAGARQSPECNYFPECGGCDWMNWDYQEQLKAKESMVTHLLSRLGLEPKERLPIVAAEQTLGYRTRIQVSRDGDKVGFYRRNTREVVDVKSCAIARPELNALLAEIREEKNDGRSREELFLDTSGKPHRRSIEMYGLDFAQIHEGQNEKLKALVADRVAQSGARTVVELYCGNGNLTFAYAQNVQKVWASDASRFSIEKAGARVKELGLSSVAFEVRNVGPGLRQRLPKDVSQSYDTLLIDPPRQGIGGDVLREWASDNLKNILYVSCAPATFAKDITRIREMFSLKSLQAIDMFPQTRHVELVAWLQRH